MITSRSLGGVIVSTLSRNIRYVGLIPALDAIFAISFNPITLVAMTNDLVQAMHCLVVELTEYVYM